MTNKLISQLSPEGTSFFIVADVLLGVVTLMDSGSVSEQPSFLVVHVKTFKLINAVR